VYSLINTNQRTANTIYKYTATLCKTDYMFLHSSCHLVVIYIILASDDACSLEICSDIKLYLSVFTRYIHGLFIQTH
jgi:hypothetical protein